MRAWHFTPSDSAGGSASQRGGAPLWSAAAPPPTPVVLGQRRDLETSSLQVSDANFLPFDRLEKPLAVEVKVRYRSSLQAATIQPADSDRVAVAFDHPVTGVMRGQAAVFYADDIVVGGGTIER
jgi:tRNA-uridine 2-sulfurtransferase